MNRRNFISGLTLGTGAFAFSPLTTISASKEFKERISISETAKYIKPMSPTCGLSTSNSGFNLSNSATLYLTVSYIADRKKNIYGVPVAPDIKSFNQTIIQQAIEYIEYYRKHSVTVSKI